MLAVGAASVLFSSATEQHMREVLSLHARGALSPGSVAAVDRTVAGLAPRRFYLPDPLLIDAGDTSVSPAPRRGGAPGPARARAGEEVWKAQYESKVSV